MYLDFYKYASVSVCLCMFFTEKGQESRSLLEEQSTSLGLTMFGLLVQRCTELLKETPEGDQLYILKLPVNI